MKKSDTPAAPNGPPCEKCGEHKGWSGPRFQKGKRVQMLVPASPSRFRREAIDTNESLIWTCNTCGWERHTPCKDV